MHYVCYIFQGGDKQSETFFGVMKATWKVLQDGFGKVRVDFGQPFSLKVQYHKAIFSGVFLIFMSKYQLRMVERHAHLHFQEYLDVSNTFCTAGVYESQWVHGAALLTPKLGSFSPLCSSDSIAEDHRYKIQGLAELIIHGRTIVHVCVKDVLG